jgi:hypothetical protein
MRMVSAGKSPHDPTTIDGLMQHLSRQMDVPGGARTDPSHHSVRDQRRHASRGDRSHRVAHSRLSRSIIILADTKNGDSRAVPLASNALFGAVMSN